MSKHPQPDPWTMRYCAGLLRSWSLADDIRLSDRRCLADTAAKLGIESGKVSEESGPDPNAKGAQAGVLEVKLDTSQVEAAMDNMYEQGRHDKFVAAAMTAMLRPFVGSADWSPLSLARMVNDYADAVMEEAWRRKGKHLQEDKPPDLLKPKEKVIGAINDLPADIELTSVEYEKSLYHDVSRLPFPKRTQDGYITVRLYSKTADRRQGGNAQ